MHPDWLRPQGLHQGTRAVMTTRAGGISTGAYASMNLGAYVGDEPDRVQSNMQTLAEALGAQPVFLKQVHGRRVVRLESLASREPGVEEADASVTTTPGLACAVTIADCLPVLFSAPNGRAVGAAHAGWRGLAAGVLEACAAEVCEAAACEPDGLRAWLGASIGPQAFEVGADVLQAFGVAPDQPGPHFQPKPAGLDGQPRWWAHLPGLARLRLQALGVEAVTGGGTCTFSDASRFFSFRRDRVCGRMAAAICLDA